jgi:hypothetical protein
MVAAILTCSPVSCARHGAGRSPEANWCARTDASTLRMRRFVQTKAYCQDDPYCGRNPTPKPCLGPRRFDEQNNQANNPPCTSQAQAISSIKTVAARGSFMGRWQNPFAVITQTKARHPGFWSLLLFAPSIRRGRWPFRHKSAENAQTRCSRGGGQPTTEAGG